MGRLSWIIRVGLKCNHKSPHKRVVEGDLITEGSDRRRRDDRSNERFEDVMLLALELKDRAESQAMERLWKLREARK